VRTPGQANEIVDLAIESLKYGENWGLAPHALFTASKELYERCEHMSQREQVLLATHLAESREEMEMFRDAAGPLYEFLEGIGRPMGDCGNKTPLGLFVGAPGRRALPHWIVVHLNEFTKSDFELLLRSNSKFRVVHCPRSHNYFGHNRFPFEQLRALGFSVCLGTDSLASNDSLSLFDEMRGFQNEFPSVSTEEMLQMVTVNAATALRQEKVLGRIRPGFCADLVAVPWSGTRDVFEEIIAFEGTVNWMLLDGKKQRNTDHTAKLAK